MTYNNFLTVLIGKHRGFAFIEFQSREDAEAAIDNMVKIEKKKKFFKLKSIL